MLVRRVDYFPGAEARQLVGPVLVDLWERYRDLLDVHQLRATAGTRGQVPVSEFGPAGEDVPPRKTWKPRRKSSKVLRHPHHKRWRL